MESKKINQLATNVAPVSTDLTIIGDPITGVSKQITLLQLAAIFSGSIAFYTNYAAFPATGTINTIYCAKDTQKLYLWSGSAYVETFPSQAVLNTYQLLSEKGVSNGYASLDSGGKVPIAQLPASIMEYKGLWSAATNTPTLANGTGDTGDVYICSAAGSVNFGAGAITFAVGDYVIYSGSIWQRSSGAVGTVTSVGISTNGNSITIGSSPITTSGTITANFAGTNLQYINGAGDLTTFPTLSGYVTSVTGTAPVVSSGGTTPAISMAAATASVDGYLSATNFVTFNNKQNAITLTTTGTSGASTLVGATLNIPNYGSALTGYVPYTGATQDVDLGAFKLNAQSLHAKGTGGLGHLGLKHQSASATASANEVSLFADSLGDLSWLNGNLYLNKFVTSANTANRSYTFPNATGTVALTSDIGITTLNTLTASIQTFATGTSGTDFNISSATATHTFNIPDASASARGLITTGTQTIAGVKTFSNGLILQYNYFPTPSTGDISLGSNSSGITITTKPSTTVYNNTLQFSNGSNSFLFPNATGTLALTSDLTGGTVTSVAALTLGTTGTDLSSTVATNTTTPVITLNVPTASATNRGALSSADWSTFNGKESVLTFSSPLVRTTNTISIPAATTSVNGYLTSTDWTTFNNKTSNTGTVTSVGLSSATSGVTIGSTPVTTSGTITIAIATATTSQNGLLSSTDWTTFNNKQGTITLTTTGTSGAATFSANTLNIPNYGSALSGYLPLTGGTLTGALSGTSATFSSSVGIGTTTTYGKLNIKGASTIPTAQTYNGLFVMESSDGRTSLQMGIQNAAVSGADGTWIQSYNQPATAAGNFALMLNPLGGNVLIGTTTDSGYKLDVNGTGRFTGALTGTSATFTTSDVNVLNIAPTTGTAQSRARITNTSGDIYFGIASSTGVSAITGTTAYSGYIATADNAKDFFIGTNGVQRFKLDGSTGAATFSSSVQITGYSAPTSGAGLELFYLSGEARLFGYDRTGSVYKPMGIGVGGSQLYLAINGNVGIGTVSPTYQLQLSTDSAAKPTSALWTIASDERIKENINPYNKGLEVLLKINPITYDYNGLGGFTKGKGGVGIIAQEIIDILPDSVSSIKAKLNETDEDETDILNFNGHELIYVLINSIKEQQIQIQNLQEQINILAK